MQLSDTDASSTSPVREGASAPDKTLQKPTEPDAEAVIGETNPPMHAALAAGAPAAPRNDKNFQNPTELDANRAVRKTNPPRRVAATSLSPRQLSAVALLCRGYRVTRVAKALGVTRQTVSEWKRDPRFRAALANYQAEVFQSLLPAAARTANDSAQLDRLARMCGRRDTDR